MIDLKYPVLMIHGINFRDMKHLCYWGRIPAALRREGVDVYFGMNDSNAVFEDNAEFLAERVKYLCDSLNVEKLNIIAHSKGGLDARCMLSHYGVADKVASLTTIASPHHGSRTVDKLMTWPQFIFRFFGAWSDLWLRICGDKKPNAYKAYSSLTTEKMAKFNEDNPDMPGVYYQSYAFKCSHAFSDIVFLITQPFVKAVEGDNDGLLPPDAVMWGDFRGVYVGKSWRGLSHCDQVDMTRLPLARGKNEGNRIADIPEFYLDIVRELAEKGF